MSDNRFSRHNRWQYSDAERLQARINTHLLYSENRDSWAGWVAAQLPSDFTVGQWLDVGTGDGTMLTALAANLQAAQIIAFDASIGMLATARQRAATEGQAVGFVNGDAQQLSFADESFDLVTAHHMLYHVPDIGRAVSEMARVLRPRGAFLATTNTADSYAELMQLRDEGADAIGLHIATNPDATARRFALEDGEGFITPHLAYVQTRLREDALLFTDVDGLMRYMLSGPLYLGTDGPQDPHISADAWQELAQWIAERVSEEIAAKGVFRVSKAAGAFVAIKEGC